jgi:uncharacterized protein involved in type VI secretion and phage assembly
MATARAISPASRSYRRRHVSPPHHKNRIIDTQTVLVTGSKCEEIYTVRPNENAVFWDCEEKWNDRTSHWVRVIHGWVGNGWVGSGTGQ